jgi:serine/threonine protein kinase
MKPEMLLDFNREAAIVARMSHPGIVSILGKGETIEGRPFYTMPFLNKGNLAKHAERYHAAHRAALEPQEKEFRDLLMCLVNACKTIAYAHSRAVVHRDLKAENIMLGDYGETLVIDWGCARICKRHEKFKVVDAKTIELRDIFAAEDTQSGLTLRYASPEQLRGDGEIGPESDIYSLGAILYKLLTGESPHQHVADAQVRRTVLSGTPLSFHQVKRGIPSGLESICKKAMRFEPAERYETALAMAEDLERYLGDLKTSVEKGSLRTSIARRIRRNPRITAGILTGVALFGLAMSMLVFAEGAARNRASSAAKQRLGMAVALAALAGGSEIESRFAMLEKESMNPTLIKALEGIQQSPSDRSLWKVIQGIIDERSKQLKQNQGVQLESMFVMSDDGTQIARSPYSNTSIGGNYAYRDYFHGLGRDLPEGETASPATGEVLSVAYRSTNQDGQIRTAFSVPIRARDAEGERVIGRLCMSLPVNSLRILDLEAMKGLNFHSMLIDMRDYPWENGSAVGLVLDGFDSRSKEGAEEQVGYTKPEQVPKLAPPFTKRIQSALVSNNGEAPVVAKASNWQASFERDTQRAADGEFAFMPIRMPHRNGQAAETGWIVLLSE